MNNIFSCGMTFAEVTAEADEAERETAEYEAKRKEEQQAYLATISKDARYYHTHKAKRMSEAATYRAKKLGAVPPWLTKEHEDAIEAIYQEAMDREAVTGVPHAVDHIVALKGVCRKIWRRSGVHKHVVCGLHVPWNLRVIPLGINNHVKKDWFDSDWPAHEDEPEHFEFELPDDGDDEIPF